MQLAKRIFTREFKIGVCEEVESKLKSQAQVCREHSLGDSLLSYWMTEYRKDPTNCFLGQGNSKYPINRHTAQDLKIKELEAALGRATYENQIFKEANALLKKSVDGEEVYKMIGNLSTFHPSSNICQAVGISRRLYYHYEALGVDRRKQKEQEDTLIRDEVEKLIKEFPKYGYRMMTKQLRRDHFVINSKPVNHKRVLRVMRENNLLAEIKKSFIATTDSNHDLLKYPNILKKEHVAISRLDQVWHTDFTYIRLPEGFCYLAVVLDAYSRKVIGYCLSKDMDTALVVTALKMALQERRIINADGKLIHHSDQGVQYCSHEYIELLKFHGIRISMSFLDSPWQNGKAESFFKTLKNNEVYLNDYENIYEAKANLFKFISDVYNARRLHSSLGYLPPDEFEQTVRNYLN